MTQHTPGPWSVETWPAREGDEQKRPRLVILADGGYLTELEDTFDRETHAAQEANARLIAAAPEMLEALRLVMSDPSRRGLLTDTVEAIRTIIRKAQGEEV